MRGVGFVCGSEHQENWKRLWIRGCREVAWASADELARCLTPPRYSVACFFFFLLILTYSEEVQMKRHFRVKQDRQAGHNVERNLIWTLKSVIMNPNSVLLKAEDWLMGGCHDIIGWNWLVQAFVSHILFYRRKNMIGFWYKFIKIYILLNRCTIWPGMWSKRVKKGFFISSQL